MIELKPEPVSDVSCPECGTKDLYFSGVLIQGLHAVNEYICSHCAMNFYHCLPVGHTVDFTILYGNSNNKLYDKQNAWVSPGLLQYFSPVRKTELGIQKKAYKNTTEIVIVNALDFLYGHCLLKLFNVQHHLDHDVDLGVVLIIPAILEWLVPAGCAEVWLVDVPLNALAYRHESIGSFVTNELKRFNKVFLSKAFSHPDFDKIDIARFTGVKPFNVGQFEKLKKCVTFVLREDRWWLTSPVSYRVFQVLRKLGMPQAAYAFLFKQQGRLVVKVIEILRKHFPEDLEISIVGIGRKFPRAFKGVALDYRSNNVTARTEQMWCEIYARSHIVIGVHGSNMILPSALAAGCIEILPEERYANIVQDLAVRYTDRRQLFLYRFVPQYAYPDMLAKHVISIMSDYQTFFRNMCINQYVQEKAINDND